MRGWHKLTPGLYTFGYRHPDTLELSEGNVRQKLASKCPADWLFYGGQVGGGKTSWLAHEAGAYCLNHDRVQAALFRRSLKDLERSIMLELRTMIPPGLAIFNSNLMRWEFANGSLLWLCYCATEADVYQYQSAQWGFLGIDESTHFTEFQFRYLVTRVRSPRSGVPRLVRLAANPGSVGHGWHKRLFVRPEDYEGERPPGPDQVWRPRRPTWWRSDQPVPTRCFMPARFADNLILQQANPDYLANVYQLGGDKGRQLAEGDWDANESAVVGALWQTEHIVTTADGELLAHGLRPGQVIPWHVIPDATWRPPAGARIFGSVDYGYGAPWSAHLHAVLPGGHLRTWREWYGARVRDVDQARRMREAIERLMKPPSDGGCSMSRPDWIVLDPSMWNSRQEMGLAKSIAEVYEDALAPLGIPVIPGAAGRGARVSRPNRWLDALSVAPDGWPWWSVTTACPDLIRTVPDVPWDEEDPDVEDDESENHAYEDTGRFFEARPVAPRVKPPDPLAGLDPLSKAHMAARELAESRKKGQAQRLSVGGFRR